MALIKARIRGIAKEFSCDAGQTLLDAAIAAGVNPPFSCSAGACQMCKASVDSGEVSCIEEGSQTHQAGGGNVLTCQSIMKSDEISISFLNS